MAETEQKTRTVHKFTYRARGSLGLQHLPDPAEAGGQRPQRRPKQVVEAAAPKCLGEVKQAALPIEASYEVKMHLRDVIALPGMVGSMVGVYNLKTFNQGGNQA